MKPRERYWQDSLVGRAATTVSIAASTSTIAKVLGCFGYGFLRLGRGSLAATLVRVDWGGSRWLVGSWVVQGLTLLSNRLQQVARGGARRWQTAWEASSVGQRYKLWRINQQRTVRFWAGLLLGMAVGTLALGHLTGKLTHRRLLVATALIPVSIVLSILPINLPAWIDNSKLLEWARYVINLGVGEKS